MSLFEKIAILGSIAGLGAYSVYQIVSTGRGNMQKEEIQKKRDEIVKNKDVKLLYSTMTFLYLQGFHQQTLESFFTLHDILQISKPNFVALQLSEKEYKEKYLPIVQHPAFTDAMKKVELYLKLKSPELAQMKEVDLKDLEKLYMIEYCKINKCQIIFGDIHRDELDRQLYAKMQLLKLTKQKEYQIPENLKELYQEAQKNEESVIKLPPTELKKDISDQSLQEKTPTIQMTEEEITKDVYINQREEAFVEAIMKELKPQYRLIPSNPYKTLLGLTEPEFVEDISKLWKNKFKATYGHEIIEGEASDDDINNVPTNQPTPQQQINNAQISKQTTQLNSSSTKQ